MKEEGNTDYHFTVSLTLGEGLMFEIESRIFSLEMVHSLVRGVNLLLSGKLYGFDDGFGFGSTEGFRQMHRIGNTRLSSGSMIELASFVKIVTLLAQVFCDLEIIAIVVW